MKVDLKGLGCLLAKGLNLVVIYAAVFGMLSSPLSEAVKSIVLRVKALSTETVCKALLYTVFCKWLAREAKEEDIRWL